MPNNIQRFRYSQGICGQKVTLAKTQSTQRVFEYPLPLAEAQSTQRDIGVIHSEHFLFFPLRLCEKLLLVCFFVTAVGISQPLQAELSTLFTTPQERQIINTNRYKSDKVVVARPIQVNEPEIREIQQLVQEEVEMSFSITGITISNSGPNTVWINNQAYEEGEHLEDKSHFKVITGDDIKVRITTPDGKHHYATSGETIDVTYLVPATN